MIGGSGGTHYLDFDIVDQFSQISSAHCNFPLVDYSDPSTLPVGIWQPCKPTTYQFVFKDIKLTKVTVGVMHT